MAVVDVNSLRVAPLFFSDMPTDFADFKDKLLYLFFFIR